MRGAPHSHATPRESPKSGITPLRNTRNPARRNSDKIKSCKNGIKRKGFDLFGGNQRLHVFLLVHIFVWMQLKGGARTPRTPRRRASSSAEVNKDHTTMILYNREQPGEIGCAHVDCVHSVCLHVCVVCALVYRVLECARSVQVKQSFRMPHILLF